MIKIIILSILLVITLIGICYNMDRQSKIANKESEDNREKGCKYNEMNMCWNRCCNFCFEKEACNFTCFDNHESCGGYK